MTKEINLSNQHEGGEDPFTKELAESRERVADILQRYGDIRVKNIHYGSLGHEDDPENMTISETPEACPPFMIALLRAGGDENINKIIDIYKVE